MSQFVVELTYAYSSPDTLGLVLTIMPCGDLHYHLKQNTV